jgi:hypothetical protein
VAFPRMLPVIAAQGHIRQWFCEDHPQRHLIFIRNKGRGRVRCIDCERATIAAIPKCVPFRRRRARGEAAVNAADAPRLALLSTQTN